MNASSKRKPPPSFVPQRWHVVAPITISIVALVASAVSALFAYRQTVEANAIARANYIASQRAFVFASVSETSWVSMKPGSSEPNAYNLLIIITNSGNTPTTNLTLVASCAPSAQDLDEPWNLFSHGTTKMERVPLLIGPRSSQTAGCSFPFDQIKQMVERKLFGFVMAEMLYYDRIDSSVQHKTRLSLKLSQIHIDHQPTPPKVSVLFSPHGKFNCADEECPN